jgi:dTDP-4-dehydrorhamnose 3,5-epimerase
VNIRIETTPIRDVYLVTPEAYTDQRGFFAELYRKDQFEEMGLPGDFVQWNHSGTVRGVTRGLHFQWDPPMGKFMRVVRGEAFLVAVDIRKGSPTLGQHVAVAASADNRLGVLAPAGCARGFCVTSDYAEIMYLCSGCYNHTKESGVLWNDPALGIAWPVEDPVLSDKDRNAQTLSDWLKRPESDFFKY